MASATDVLGMATLLCAGGTGGGGPPTFSRVSFGFSTVGGGGGTVELVGGSSIFGGSLTTASILGGSGRAAGAGWGGVGNCGRARRHRPRGGRRGLGHLNALPRLQRRHVDFLGDLALGGRGLGEFGERFDQGGDDARAPCRLRGRRQEVAGQQDDQRSGRRCGAGRRLRPRRRCGRGKRGRPTRSGGEVHRHRVVALRFPSINQGLETTSECSLILSRIARAAANVRRAASAGRFR